MDQYATEQEQIEQIKRWWKENGKSLVFGLVVGVGGLAGYRYWDAAETARAEAASINYEYMLKATTDGRAAEAQQSGEAILEAYPDTTYARLAGLMLAKMAVEAGNHERAQALLEDVIEGSPESEVAHVARSRLARLALADGRAEDAAALLAAIPATGDSERFVELRADVRLAQGDVEGAKTLYLQALARAESLGLERGAIQLKLDNLGGADRS
ncbi:MAG: YfgM family protein [Gammaproteobacteria bacterium]